MITNSDSAGRSQKFITPREKKIGDLAQVLERQRQTIKSLLASKNQQSHIQRNHTAYTQIDKIDSKVKNEKQPQKYQQLCNQILNMGNKLLSGRKPSTLQSYRDAQVSLDLKQMREIKQVVQQKGQQGDEEMDYLKSDQYRLYLQNLTKDEDCSKVDLLKRMKQTRNNNVYTKPTSKVFKNLQIKSSARDHRSYRQLRETDIPRKRQTLHNFQPISINFGVIGRHKDYEMTQNVFQPISNLLIHNVNSKDMRHSPTMKDISKPTPFQINPKKEQKESRSVSRNNKIQSRTVDCLVFTGLTPPKNLQKQQSKDVEKKAIFQDSPKICRQFREWDVYKIDYTNFKSKDKKHQFENKQVNKKYIKCNMLTESYSLSNLKNQTYKAESNYMDYKRQKNSYNAYENNRKCKAIQEQSSHQFTHFGESSQANIYNGNLYQLNFKLADPKMKPQYSQIKTPDKVYKEKTPLKVSQKLNMHFPAKVISSHKQETVKTPKKQSILKKQLQNIMPYCINFPQNKKWSLQQSQATSAVTKSACDQQIYLHKHSRSKSKLTVVTASKKQKR